MPRLRTPKSSKALKNLTEPLSNGSDDAILSHSSWATAFSGWTTFLSLFLSWVAAELERAAVPVAVVVEFSLVAVPVVGPVELRLAAVPVVPVVVVVVVVVVLEVVVAAGCGALVAFGVAAACGAAVSPEVAADLDGCGAGGRRILPFSALCSLIFWAMPMPCM